MTNTGITTNRPVQRKNRHKITVTYPADWMRFRDSAGTTVDYFYPTLTAMDLAAAGFRLQGCEVR